MVKDTHLLLGMPAEKCSAQEEFCMVRREGKEGRRGRRGEGGRRRLTLLVYNNRC